MLLYTLRRASPKTHPRSADPAGRGPPPAPSIIYILVGLLLEVFCLNHMHVMRRERHVTRRTQTTAGECKKITLERPPKSFRWCASTCRAEGPDGGL